MKKRLDLSPYEFEVFNERSGEKEKVTVKENIVKESFANILGNSECDMRESYLRNKLGDKILETPNNYIDLSVSDFNKLEKSLDQLPKGAKIKREHKYLLYRIYDAEEIPEVKEE
jgi:hypothetical protein